jgi:hypothetical protein
LKTSVTRSALLVSQFTADKTDEVFGLNKKLKIILNSIDGFV